MLYKIIWPWLRPSPWPPLSLFRFFFYFLTFTLNLLRVYVNNARTTIKWKWERKRIRRRKNKSWRMATLLSEPVCEMICKVDASITYDVESKVHTISTPPPQLNAYTTHTHMSTRLVIVCAHRLNASIPNDKRKKKENLLSCYHFPSSLFCILIGRYFVIVHPIHNG